MHGCIPGIASRKRNVNNKLTNWRVTYPALASLHWDIFVCFMVVTRIYNASWFTHMSFNNMWHAYRRCCWYLPTSLYVISYYQSHYYQPKMAELRVGGCLQRLFLKSPLRSASGLVEPANDQVAQDALYRIIMRFVVLTYSDLKPLGYYKQIYWKIHFVWP